MRKINYKRNISLYHALSFHMALVFHRGIFILYLLHLGFSNTQVGTLQSALFISNFLFEIPTGLLGDKIGRKWSVFLGLCSFIIFGTGMALCRDYGLFLGLFIIKGIGFAFVSGSGNALLYDSLKCIKKEGKYLKINSRISTISSVVLGIAMLLGGYMKNISWNFVYFSYVGSMIIALIVVSFMYEKVQDFKTEGNVDKTTFKQNFESIRSVMNFFKSTRGKWLAVFMLSYGTYEAAMTPFFIYGQNLFKAYGLTAGTIGLIYSIIQFSSGVAYYMSEKVSKLFSVKRLAYFTLLLSSVLLSLNLLQSFVVSLVVFYLLTVFPEILYIVTDNYIQERIPTNIRASVLSSFSLIQSTLISLSYIVVAFLFDTFSVYHGMASLGAAPLLSFIIFVIYFKFSKGVGILKTTDYHDHLTHTVD